MVGLDGEKMSQVQGQPGLRLALRGAGHDPMAIRLALLAHHYRSDWEWTDADLAAAEGRLARWRDAVAAPAGPPADRRAGRVRRHLADDLDAPAALAVVDRWAEQVRLRGGSIGADDPTAPGLVRDTVDALLGIAL